MPEHVFEAAMRSLCATACVAAIGAMVCCRCRSRDGSADAPVVSKLDREILEQLPAPWW